MDADTLVVQNIDDLFDREEFSAASDPGWPDCFNSGVFVYRPSLETYKKLLDYALSQRSFDGGDQGLLNMYFSNWFSSDISRRLPFIYNCTCQNFYTYAPALAHFRPQVRVVHFVGAQKPWRQTLSAARHKDADDSSTDDEFLQLWWHIYTNKVHKSLADHIQLTPPVLKALGHTVPPQHSASPRIPESGSSIVSVPQISDRERQYAWERGEIDYTGSDRFSSILEKLNVNLQEDNSSKDKPTLDSPPKSGSSQRGTSSK
jgi:glycogenin glucosyltransferase